ncbi:MAG: HAD family phosphatase [Bryobacteraceae bacterium]
MNIRAVIFDFGGVLAFVPAPEQWKEAVEFAGTTSALYDAFWKFRLPYDAGGDPFEYWRSVAAELGTTFDQHTIEGMIEREIQFWSRFDRRVFAWANELRAAGIRTAMLSNLPRPLGERLRATPGFFDHFDHLTLSYELGVNKPNAAIYRHAIDGLGIQAEEALFLDDRADNIEGARAVGLQCEQFTTWEDFVANQAQRYPLPKPR